MYDRRVMSVSADTSQYNDPTASHNFCQLRLTKFCFPFAIHSEGERGRKGERRGRGALICGDNAAEGMFGETARSTNPNRNPRTLTLTLPEPELEPEPLVKPLGPRRGVCVYPGRNHFKHSMNIQDITTHYLTST